MLLKIAISRPPSKRRADLLTFAEGDRLNGLGMARRRSVAIKSPKEIISLGGTVQIKLAGAILLWSLMSVSVSFAQQEPDLFQGYEGEWNHVSAQLISLAEATPPEKFTWR